ncbi:MAG: FG-GAP repeat domain-containing protein [Vicinamibacterales bacterium]
MGLIRRASRLAVAVGGVALCASALPSQQRSVHAEAAAPPVRFREHVVAQQVPSGYQVIPVDMNRDGRLDLVGLGTAKQMDLNWYESPSWTPHLITNQLTSLINAAAHDIDGDGIPELAVQHGFSTAIKTSRGGVSLLTHGPTPDAPWSIHEIDTLPTSHRIRWMVAERDRTILVNAPLLGQSADATDAHAPNRIVFYEGPDWKRRPLGEVDGLLHGIQPTNQPPFARGPADVLLSAGFTGVVQHEWRKGRWRSTLLTGGSPAAWPKSGSSDVAVGRHGRTPLIVTLEPWHGNEVVVYRREKRSWIRQVLDDQLTDAHALVTGDFDGSGRSAIVAGERQGQRSVRLYWPPSRLGEPWTAQVLDAALNASGCSVADINSDGRLDIVCIGSAQPGLKWYENVGR